MKPIATSLTLLTPPLFILSLALAHPATAAPRASAATIAIPWGAETALLGLSGYGFGLEEHLSSGGLDDPAAESARGGRIADEAWGIRESRKTVSPAPGGRNQGEAFYYAPPRIPASAGEGVETQPRGLDSARATDPVGGLLLAIQPGYVAGDVATRPQEFDRASPAGTAVQLPEDISIQPADTVGTEVRGPGAGRSAVAVENPVAGVDFVHELLSGAAQGDSVNAVVVGGAVDAAGIDAPVDAVIGGRPVLAAVRGGSGSAGSLPNVVGQLLRAFELVKQIPLPLPPR